MMLLLHKYWEIQMSNQMSGCGSSNYHLRIHLTFLSQSKKIQVAYILQKWTIEGKVIPMPSIKHTPSSPSHAMTIHYHMSAWAKCCMRWSVPCRLLSSSLCFKIHSCTSCKTSWFKCLEVILAPGVIKIRLLSQHSKFCMGSIT
jgi:hypothetical protein